MTINEIFNTSGLSVRSFNVCKSNNLLTLEELKNYYNNHKTFCKLKNCGKKSEEELINLFHKPPVINAEDVRTINEIFNNSNLNVRSFNVCVSNGLTTLEEIKNYYEIHKTFRFLKNCGNKSNQELIELCHEFKTKEIEESVTEVDKWSNDLSYRSLHVCMENKIQTLEDLCQYYETHHTFKNFRNCGTKTNRELLALIKSAAVSPLERGEVSTEKIYEKLDIERRNLIESEKELLIMQLSVRSRNALVLFLQNDLTLPSIIENILEKKNFDINTLKNVGLSSIPQLTRFISNLRAAFLKIAYSLEANPFGLDGCTVSKSNGMTPTLGHSNIFKTVDQLILTNSLFNKKQTEVFKKAFSLYENITPLQLDQLSAEFDLTTERVRQVRFRCFKELSKNLDFLSFHKDDLLESYGIDMESDFILIDDSIQEQINQKSDTNFTKGFMTYILRSHLKNSFSLVGNDEDVLIQVNFSRRFRHNWKYMYLVKNSIFDHFDFDALLQDLYKRLEARIDQSYKFNFESYLSRFLRKDDESLLIPLSKICEVILNKELNIILDLDENICFTKTKSKQLHEYVYAALQELGKPSKVEEICTTLQQRYPEINADVAKVRSSLKRSNGFVPVSRTSVFGLQIWEKQIENFKGGTIRDIIYKFLETSDRPMSMLEIMNHILKFRPNTNLKSVATSLKLDKNAGYKYFANSHIGLSHKVYSIIYKVVPDREYSRNDWGTNFNLLTKFLSNYGRFPSNNIGHEKKLYRWYRIQRLKLASNTLGEKEQSRLSCLLNEYESVPKI